MKTQTSDNILRKFTSQSLMLVFFFFALSFLPIFLRFHLFHGSVLVFLFSFLIVIFLLATFQFCLFIFLLCQRLLRKRIRLYWGFFSPFDVLQSIAALVIRIGNKIISLTKTDAKSRCVVVVQSTLWKIEFFICVD